MKLRSRVQLRKDHHVDDIVSCAVLATTRDILPIELRWWQTETDAIPNACAQRLLARSSVNLSPRGARELFVRGPSNHRKRSATSPRDGW
jgi:hypothetical protein